MIIHYNKLVRDRIPEKIINDGNVPFTHVASDDEYWQKLKEKLKEESVEFIEKDDDKELVDILEVINVICEFKRIDRDKLEELRKQKLEKRGGFKKKIILDETH